MLRFIVVLSSILLSSFDVASQPSGFNYDESKVPEYELPDPLTMEDGTPVKDAKIWVEKRRPQILHLFETQVYGKTPEAAYEIAYHVETDRHALNNTAIRKQATVYPFGKEKAFSFDILIYLPKDTSKPVPAFVGLNFAGNHSIHKDPEIKLNPGWMRNRDGVEDHRATEESRGVSASRWPVDTILKRGYALATIYCGDLDPDYDDGFQNGVHPFFYTDGQSKPAADEWGTIGAWAWGLSRALDYFEEDREIDAKRVAVMGHSRLGKTSLWAGAQDERFAMVISNNSGCGGAALSRRAFGETVKRINTSFPHWFCDNFNRYNENESALPVDQHQLIALIAPRPVYIASAAEDQWADPRGEFLSGKHADPVYRLLTGVGLNANEMPAVEEPSIGRISYHIRSGGHNVTDFDWEQYLKTADRFMK